MSVETRPVPQVCEVVREVEVRSELEYDRDIGMTVARLAVLSDMTLSERRQAAYAIVGEEVADDEIRERLRNRYCSKDEEVLRPRSMRMLDGGYTQMWAAARTS